MTTRLQEPEHVVEPVQTTWLETLIRAREISLIILIVLLVAGTASKHHDFLLSADGWRELLRQPTILILIAVGEAMVIVTRNVDLSVGSVMGLSTYLAGWLFANVEGIPIVAVVLAGSSVRRSARTSQRAAGRVPRRAVPGDHPGDPLCLPRYRGALDRR